MKREVVVTLADGTEVRTVVSTVSTALALWTAIGNIVTGHTKTDSAPISVHFSE